MFAPTPAPATEPLIQLPIVEPDEMDEAWDEFERIQAALPEFSVALSKNEANRAHEKLSKGTGPVGHAEALWLIVPIVESLFDDEVASIGIPFHVQLMMMCEYPSIPEALVVQVAFGRKAGEEHSRKIARLADRAQRRGLTIDEYVQHLHDTGTVPRDRLMRLFLGETRRPPSDERLRRAVEVLRRTAALSPEPLRGPVLSAIAWMQWARGRRAVSLAYLEEALRVEPRSILAGGLRMHFLQRTPAWLTAEAQATP
ncbi:hypothetical protein [Microbacterium sp.]|uniref:hypothetical protein n=1 Tax=Microbacterium sp. TaxID=51671 RepID=UPI003F997BDB